MVAPTYAVLMASHERLKKQCTELAAEARRAKQGSRDTIELLNQKVAALEQGKKDGLRRERTARAEGFEEGVEHATAELALNCDEAPLEAAVPSFQAPTFFAREPRAPEAIRSRARRLSKAAANAWDNIASVTPLPVSRVAETLGIEEGAVDMGRWCEDEVERLRLEAMTEFLNAKSQHPIRDAVVERLATKDPG